MLKISYVFDGGSPQLIFAGDVSVDQTEHIFDAVIAEPEFRKGVGMVIDSSNLQHEYSHDEVRQLALHVADRRESLGHHLAIVVSPDNELHYGLARMFSGYAGLHDLTVGVFTSVEDARRWIVNSSTA